MGYMSFDLARNIHCSRAWAQAQAPPKLGADRGRGASGRVVVAEARQQQGKHGIDEKDI